MRYTIHSLLFILSITSSIYALAKETIETELLAVANESRLLQYYENGENKGPSIEILEAILKEAQFEAKIEFMPWARAFLTAKTNPNTLILSMIRTPEREHSFHWITQVSHSTRVFISLKSRPESHADNMQQAKQKLIAVIKGSAGYNELISNGFSDKKNLYVVADAELMMTLLENERVDLVYEDPHNVRSILNRRGKTNIDIRYKKIAPENERISYIAISKPTDIKIVNRLQQAARKFEKTQEYSRLVLE